MRQSYLDNSYHDVSALITEFIEYAPEDGEKMLANLNDVHDVPEIGEAIFEEERDDLNKVITTLKKRGDLSTDEMRILNDAIVILNDIECSIAYSAGVDRTSAKHTIIYNFEHLKDLSSEEIYQKCLSFAEVNIRQLFNHRLGARPGTVIFYSALDVLYSFYCYTLIMDEFKPNDRELIEMLIYDIAKNINKHACDHLEAKDNVFVKYKNI